MRILGISGSLRRDSVNRRLLRAAALQLPSGVELVELDTAVLKGVPHYDQDDDHDRVGTDVDALRDAIAGADAVLFATPEYNGSVPGTLKNAIDWASRPREDAALAGKPVAVVGASTGMFGAVWAQGDLRQDPRHRRRARGRPRAADPRRARGVRGRRRTARSRTRPPSSARSSRRSSPRSSPAVVAA